MNFILGRQLFERIYLDEVDEYRKNGGDPVFSTLAAFLAADDEGIANVKHRIRALHREYQKMGKLLTGDALGEYPSV